MDKLKSHISAGSTLQGGNLSVDASTVGAYNLQAPILAKRKNRRGLKLEIDYTSKLKVQEDPLLDLLNRSKEIVDNKFEVQRKALEKNNRTMVKPRINIIEVIPEKPIKAKTLRGNKRAEQHAFFKDLVNSNKVNVEWPIKSDPVVVEQKKSLDDYWKGKDAKKSFSCIRLKQLEANLLTPDENIESSQMVPDDKRLPQQSKMVESIEKIEATSLSNSEIALHNKIDKLVEMMTLLEARCAKLEEQNQQLLKENQLLKEQREVKKQTIVEPEKEKPVTKVTKIKAAVHKIAYTRNKTETIKGFEQSEEIEDTQKVKTFEPSPKKPEPVKETDSKTIKKNKLKQWYQFDSKKIEEHQKQVLNSVCRDKTFAQTIRDNGIPKQKIKYVYKLKTIVDETLHPKPAGVPYKKWKGWLATLSVSDAYKAAEKYLYLLFKKEMYIFRQRWIKHSKEFNPFLSEPKLVWEAEVDRYEENRDQPMQFINSWRQLVKTYKPRKSINVNWYHSEKQNV
ncbi:VP1 [Haematobia irritans Nora virus]|nr:VP1 [Haematobia irritans Nora virus]